MSVGDFVNCVMKVLLSGVIGVMGTFVGFIVLLRRDQRGLYVIGVGMLGEGQGICTNKMGVLGRKFREFCKPLLLKLHLYTGVRMDCSSF